MAPAKAKESKPKAVEKPARGPAAAVKEKTALAGRAEARPSAAEKTQEKSKPGKMETVSLIDKPKAKATDGTPKVRTTILPPISKLVAKPGLTVPPPGPVEPPPAPLAPVAEVPTVASTDGQATAEVAPPVEEEPKNVITIKPPIIVKELATQLTLKNFQLIKELMDDFNIFVNANQTIEPDVATKIASGTDLFWKKNGAKKEAAFTRKKRSSLLPRLRSRRSRKSSNPARPSSHSWDTSITVRLR